MSYDKRKDRLETPRDNGFIYPPLRYDVIDQELIHHETKDIQNDDNIALEDLIYKHLLQCRVFFLTIEVNGQKYKLRLQSQSPGALSHYWDGDNYYTCETLYLSPDAALWQALEVPKDGKLRVTLLICLNDLKSTEIKGLKIHRGKKPPAVTIPEQPKMPTPPLVVESSTTMTEPIFEGLATLRNPEQFVQSLRERERFVVIIDLPTTGERAYVYLKAAEDYTIIPPGTWTFALKVEIVFGKEGRIKDYDNSTVEIVCDPNMVDMVIKTVELKIFPQPKE
jgi:hypothetical protein